MKNSTKVGIIIGISLGLLVSMYWIYNRIWGITFLGKDILAQHSSEYKISMYQIFQDIRDPYNVEYRNIDYFSKDFENHMYIKRSLVIADMSPQDTLDYYSQETSKYCEIDLDYSHKIIKLSKLLRDNQKIEGYVRIVQDKPVFVEIIVCR